MKLRTDRRIHPFQSISYERPNIWAVSAQNLTMRR